MMKRRMFFLTSGSGGGTSQTTEQTQQTGQTTDQTNQSIEQTQQTTVNSTNQTQNTQNQTSATEQTQQTTVNSTNQTQNTQNQQTNNSQQANQTTQQTTSITEQQPQKVYVSVDEVQRMIAENNKTFEKKELINEISQNSNLKSLLDKKFPKWNEKSLEQIKDIKVVYEGIVQSQMVSGASEKPGNVSTQNSDVFISSGNANKDYENYCKFKREQKKKQQANPTTNNATNK